MDSSNDIVSSCFYSLSPLSFIHRSFPFVSSSLSLFNAALIKSSVERSVHLFLLLTGNSRTFIFIIYLTLNLKFFSSLLFIVFFSSLKLFFLTLYIHLTTFNRSFIYFPSLFHKFHRVSEGVMDGG